MAASDSSLPATPPADSPPVDGLPTVRSGGFCILGAGVATPHSRRNRRYQTRRGPGGVYRPQSVGRAYRLADPAIASAPPGSPIPFTLTTPGVKRDGLDLATLPFTKQRYDLNPVVLAFHRYDQFSIGHGEIEIVQTRAGEALLANAWFDIDDPVGAEADRKYRSGFLFAVSLGWDDIDNRGVPVRASKGRPVARDILEFSVVSVPADPDALLDMEPDDAARTRSFMAGVRSMLPAGDARISDLDEILRRLAQCEGAECDVLLGQASQRLDERRGFLVPGYMADFQDDDEASASDLFGNDAEADHPARGAADDVSPDTEARRRAAMAAMFAAVWVDDADEADDDDREAARKSLLPEYRRLGLVPPASLPASVVAALPTERRAALFANGETQELGMTTIIRRNGAAVQASAAGDTRAGAKLSKATRSTIADGTDQIKAGLKTIMAVLDDGGERSSDARSCGCGNGSSHTPAQTVTQASGAQTATTLETELARLSELYPGVEFAATVPDGQAGARALVGIESLQEAADEGSQMSLYTYGTVLPDDLKQAITDEVAAQVAAGAASEPVMISLSEWLQDPDYPFEPGTKALFSFDLTPEMAERVKAAALGLDQPATEEPAEEEAPAEEEVPAEEVPADGTASAGGSDAAVIDPAVLAMFQAAIGAPA